jgi:hypothetical protein
VIFLILTAGGDNIAADGKSTGVLSANRPTVFTNLMMNVVGLRKDLTVEIDYEASELIRLEEGFTMFVLGPDNPLLLESVEINKGIAGIETEDQADVV